MTIWKSEKLNLLDILALHDMLSSRSFGDTIMGSASYFHRLPPEVRETILEYLDEQDGTSPVSVASVVHLLGERHLHVELAEASLKSSIAEAAIKRGFYVAFDGT